MATTPAKRACPECGMLLPEEAEFCPVCALRQVAETQSESVLDTSSQLCFERYQVLKNEDGTPLELGRGAMGLTYKAIDAGRTFVFRGLGATACAVPRPVDYMF